MSPFSWQYLCRLCQESTETRRKIDHSPQPEVNEECTAFLDVSLSSYRNRDVDDFLPRKNLDQLYKDEILETEEEILAASKKYLVERKYIDKRIKHLKLLGLKKELRKKETQDKWKERGRKDFQDYDWVKEIEQNNFKNLVVKDLRKYCAKFSLGSGGRKDDLKNRVRGHWFTAKGKNTLLPGELHVGGDAPGNDLVAPPKLVVVVAEMEEEIIELEEFAEGADDCDEALDSDCDDVVNFEEFSSDTENEED